MMRATNVLHLGLKEFVTLWRDRVMLVLIIWAFSVGIYTAATAQPETLQAAPIAIVDEDRSALSTRIIDAFYRPYFVPPSLVDLEEVDRGLDAGLYTFALDIPPDFQRDVLAGRQPSIQLNVDATRQSQAYLGSGYVQSIVAGEINEFVQRSRGAEIHSVTLIPRMRFNPASEQSWFGSVTELINNITMLSIVLTGAALIREREHGTIEHLLAMPLTSAEIMTAKVWSMGLVVLVTAFASLQIVVRGMLSVPVAGSLGLFLAGTTLHLFATTSMGIFLGIVARSMPQFALLVILVLLPLEILSGGTTPQESMPDGVRWAMQLAPTTHFVKFAQAILFRGAGLAVVWPHFLAIGAIGAAFFAGALLLLRRAIVTMQQ